MLPRDSNRKRNSYHESAPCGGRVGERSHSRYINLPSFNVDYDIGYGNAYGQVHSSHILVGFYTGVETHPCQSIRE